MKGYLGEEEIKDLKNTPFEGYTEKDWCLYFIGKYGDIDGDHHKNWVKDQVVQLLNGVGVEVKLARWENGTEEYRVILSEEKTEEYKAWLEKVELEEGDYSSGSPP